MPTKQITWPDGSTATLTYNGQGSGTITVQSEPNNHYEARSAQIKVRTTDGSDIEKTVTIVQAAKVRTDISNAVVTAPTQTYSGSALTPTPTVTLNGVTIPSSGYDVAYSDNTNAGTATITITGKDDYTGTAVGTFTINKANPTYTAPTARTGLTYSGSSQYLVTAGSTSHGTIQYSSNGSSWSTTRPSSTNAGSYTTYWRLVGDSNHNDVASTSLSTTIAKASRTLSFADAYVVLAPSGNVTKTATPSAGSGDGAITYSISSTTYATINSSSGKVTAKTSDGSAVVTATIAEGTNYLSATASYNLYVFATIHNYDYSASVKSLTLPPGSYKLQCWGAQGGESPQTITSDRYGGKGGYSEGVLTVSEEKTVYIFVGGRGNGQSGATQGGWNGGGACYGGKQTVFGGDRTYTSYPASGGGATDIALTTSSMNYSNGVTNRSAASYKSRMIVAGGGGGGNLCRKVIAASIAPSSLTSAGGTINWSTGKWFTSTAYVASLVDVTNYRGATCKITKGTNAIMYSFLTAMPVSGQLVSYATGYQNPPIYATSDVTVTVPSDAVYMFVYIYENGTDYKPSGITFSLDAYLSTGGAYGGGAYGGAEGGISPAASQSGTAAGAGLGYAGSSYTYDNNPPAFPAAGGGAGWYGGADGSSNAEANWNRGERSAGGSGFVNTAASAGNRPSGYTGLQLDSGETKAGNTSFIAPSGGNETGHSGNGYARITRLS